MLTGSPSAGNACSFVNDGTTDRQCVARTIIANLIHSIDVNVNTMENDSQFRASCLRIDLTQSISFGKCPIGVRYVIH